MTPSQFIIYIRASLHNITNMSFYRKTERVFCYELYHQMRLLKDNPTDYRNQFQSDGTQNIIISSEIAKNIIDGQRKSYPDFVFHNDNNHDNNDDTCQFAAIEVKLAGSPSEGVTSDIIKLHKMVTGILQYQIGVLIYIGSDTNKFRKKINKIIENNTNPDIQDFIVTQETNHNIFFIFKFINNDNSIVMGIQNGQLQVLDVI